MMIPRLLLSVLLLVLLAWQLDMRLVLSQFTAIDPGWLLLALGLTQFQVLLSAWRWHFTARRLGLALPLPHAVREYYLALFLNQVLPGGVLGDVSRAWRHARTEVSAGSAVRAVILERASGQLLIALAVPLCLLLQPALLAAIPVPLVAVTLVLLLAGVVVLAGLAQRPAWRVRLRPWWRDLRRGLLDFHALPLQLLSSALLLASYVLVFWAVARGLGDATPAVSLMPLVPLLLLAMLLPISFAGWGVREGAAAVLWLLAGLDPTAGVAASIGYGLMVLFGSLPGAAVLWLRSNRYRRSSPREN